MKTHELSKALGQLSKVLRSLPDQEIESLGENLSPMNINQQNLGVNLVALSRLSKFTRSDWERVVKDFDIPVELRPRDGARDVMGKILAYLADNEIERARVANKSRISNLSATSELSNALTFLLSND